MTKFALVLTLCASLGFGVAQAPADHSEVSKPSDNVENVSVNKANKVVPLAVLYPRL